jgi:predicted  nucleic acid-binding Zn-ribbon protein
MVAVEENDAPGGPPGGGMPTGRGPEGRGRAGDGDLLAERRARRAAESGEHALLRRAEAAEATVRTLESHVATLQQRLREAEDEHERMTELIDAARRGPEYPAALDLEHELKRAEQREYAEQRLRAEAEDRLAELEREGRAQLEQLSGRLRASEHHARELAARLEGVQRELAEAEHAAAAERGSLRRAERALQARLAGLERGTEQIHRAIEAERALRARAEHELERMRAGHRRLHALIAELKAAIERLSRSAAERPEPRPQPPAAPGLPAAAGPQPAAAEPSPAGSVSGAPEPAVSGEQGGAERAGAGEMAEALAAAVERLRARVEERSEYLAAPPPPPPPPPQAPPKRQAHKHSMSLIGRWRIARKQRRGR